MFIAINVDDFLWLGENEGSIKRLIQVMNKIVNLGMGQVERIKVYNGVHIKQCQSLNKISVESYLSKIIKK